MRAAYAGAGAGARTSRRPWPRARPQRGRGGIGTIIVAVLLAILAYEGWGLLHQPQAPLPATASPAGEASARTKLLVFAGALAEARISGRPVPVSVTFTDGEISSLAGQAAEAKGLPVSDISLHATAGGTVQGRCTAQVAGQQLPVAFEGVPRVSAGNQVQLSVTRVQVGAFPVPGPIADQVTPSIRQPLEVGQPLAGFQDVRVSTTDGALTVSGVAQP